MIDLPKNLQLRIMTTQEWKNYINDASQTVPNKHYRRTAGQLDYHYADCSHTIQKLMHTLIFSHSNDQVHEIINLSEILQQKINGLHYMEFKRRDCNPESKSFGHYKRGKRVVSEKLIKHINSKIEKFYKMYTWEILNS